jgi:beta-glucosidase-like glycosyl hydrolase
LLGPPECGTSSAAGQEAPADARAREVEEQLTDDERCPGWVMSEWGATPAWEFALAGLDQDSGVQLDAIVWRAEPFVGPLREAYTAGKLPKERLSDMVRRILRSMFAVGIDTWGPAPEVDMAAHHEIALEAARQGIVVLKNDDILPLATNTTTRIAVIEAVAAACPSTVVVLETGNPVDMPWRDRVKGIVQAWYPGQAGGQAIAEILTGAVNPSGHLPITFPASLAQTPTRASITATSPWKAARRSPRPSR